MIIGEHTTSLWNKPRSPAAAMSEIKPPIECARQVSWEVLTPHDSTTTCPAWCNEQRTSVFVSEKRAEGHTASSCYDYGDKVDSVHHVHIADRPRASRNTYWRFKNFLSLFLVQSLFAHASISRSLPVLLLSPIVPLIVRSVQPSPAVPKDSTRRFSRRFFAQGLHRKVSPKRKLYLPGSRKSSGRPGGHRSFPRTSPGPKNSGRTRKMRIMLVTRR